MDVGIIKSVSLLYLPENEKLLNIIQEYSHPSEEFRVCKSLEDFVVNLTSLMSEENSFITCYVEGTKGSIDFIQENLLTSVQSVVVTSFPKAVVFFYAKESEGYQAPPHIQNIINSSDLSKLKVLT